MVCTSRYAVCETPLAYASTKQSQVTQAEEPNGGQRTRTAVADQATRPFRKRRPVPTGNTLQTLCLRNCRLVVVSGLDCDVDLFLEIFPAHLVPKWHMLQFGSRSEAVVVR